MTPPTNDLATLRQWIGRTESTTEAISAQTCNRLGHTLGRDTPLADGDVLPPLWHFAAHVVSVPLDRLGPDGHPERGDFLPPVALPRRMWVGGRLAFHGDLEIGESVTKTSTITDIDMKVGRTGSLCFVTVQHDLTVRGDARVSEQQELVFRDDPDPSTPTPEPRPARVDHEFGRVITPSEVMLFRYSALTFNAHRIHYDRDYARTVEGYPDLVVHGPLTATLLADLAVGQTGRRLATFSFRALSPLFDTDPFHIAGACDGDSLELWAATSTGGLAMSASAEFAS